MSFWKYFNCLGTTGLVVGSLSLAFVPLIEKTALHLNHLECDAELLELAKICEPMQLSTFVASQNSKTSKCLYLLVLLLILMF